VWVSTPELHKALHTHLSVAIVHTFFVCTCICVLGGWVGGYRPQSCTRHCHAHISTAGVYKLGVFACRCVWGGVCVCIDPRAVQDTATHTFLQQVYTNHVCAHVYACEGGWREGGIDPQAVHRVQGTAICTSLHWRCV